MVFLGSDDMLIGDIIVKSRLRRVGGRKMKTSAADICRWLPGEGDRCSGCQ
jgi:hypothetical protein